MIQRAIKMEPEWLAELEAEFAQSYMRELSQFLRIEMQSGKRIYPSGGAIFAAFEHTPLNTVKVVILGQDPYHGPGQAHGLSFSVPKDIPLPPSLKNIYQELSSDVGIRAPEHGNLTHWADQGVLLLNSVLTVQQGQAGSHQGKGWERFTDAVIAVLNQHNEHLVFMLWGAYAQKKGAVIDRARHLVLAAPHPSPLSAHRGFFGCRHFSKANEYLSAHGKAPIDWQI